MMMNEEEMTGGKKKRAKLALKDFVEVERWDRMEMSDTGILVTLARWSSSSNSARAIPAR